MSKPGPIPAHEPRSHKGLLHAEPPALGGILAPGGPSRGEMDPHPDAKHERAKPAAKPRPKRKRKPKASKPAES